MTPSAEIKAPRSEDWATRNPYVSGGGGRGGGAGAAGGAGAESADRPQANFVWLASHGHILLACDLAMRNYSNVIARNFKLEQKAVYDEVRANPASRSAKMRFIEITGPGGLAQASEKSRTQ